VISYRVTSWNNWLSVSRPKWKKVATVPATLLDQVPWRLKGSGCNFKWLYELLEAAIGIEPMNKGFAVLIRGFHCV